MGFCVDGMFYVDRCLPMGCAISCAYFEKFSTFLQWCISKFTGQRGVVHYLDDFLFVGPRDSVVCGELLSASSILFGSLGVPVASDKPQGPVTCLSYLGIEVDTGAGCCRLPADKVSKLLEQIEDCLSRERAHLQNVQSLLGPFNFACRIIPMGRVFL